MINYKRGRCLETANQWSKIDWIQKWRKIWNYQAQSETFDVVIKGEEKKWKSERKKTTTAVLGQISDSRKLSSSTNSQDFLGYDILRFLPKNLKWHLCHLLHLNLKLPQSKKRKKRSTGNLIHHFAITANSEERFFQGFLIPQLIE